MAEARPARIWVMRAAFIGIALLLMFYRLLPLDMMPPRFAGPDLLVALCFAWALRRPTTCRRCRLPVSCCWPTSCSSARRAFGPR